MTLETETFRILLGNVDSRTEDGWTALAEKVRANPSLSPGWTKIISASHGLAGLSQLTTIKMEKEILLALPFYLAVEPVLRISMRRFKPISSLVSYHADVLHTMDPLETVNIIVSEAQRESADVVEIGGLVDSSQLSDAITSPNMRGKYYCVALAGETSPYLPLGGTWKDLVESMSKKFRYKLRKRSESLETMADLEMKWFTEKDELTELFDAMRSIENHSWKKAAGHSIFDNPTEAQYHCDLLPYLAERNAMYANVLFKSSEPIAYNLCCIWGGWVGQLKTSFDSRYPELSPGSIVIDAAIEHAMNMSAREFDFLGDTDPHKLAWTKLVRTHTNFTLYLKSSWKGRLVGFLKSIQCRMRRLRKSR